MLGYILLILSLVILGNSKKNDQKLFLMFIAITVFSGLRYGIGYDYYSYLETCIPGYVGQEYEPIPLLFQTLAQQSFPYLFFILSSIFISTFYCLGIRKSKHNHYPEVLFYVCFPFLFFNQLGIVRQGMASAVIFLAICIPQEENRRLIKQIILLAIAVMCHQSALLGVLILIPWQKVHPALLWVMFIGSFLLGEFIVPLFEGILSVLPLFDHAVAEKAMGYLDNEYIVEGRMLKYVMYFIVIIALLLYDRIAKEDKDKYLLSLLVLGASVFALLSFNSTLSKRLCMFFFSSSIIIVPSIVRSLKIKRAVFSILCIVLFSLQIYIASHNVRGSDPPGCSVSYPYQTFLGRL